jgi:hypothetical protein
MKAKRDGEAKKQNARERLEGRFHCLGGRITTEIVLIPGDSAKPEGKSVDEESAMPE